MRTHHILLIVTALWLPVCSAQGQVSGVITHQGRLMVNGTNYSGNANFKFSLVNAAGDFTYWSHNGTGVGGAEPTGAPIVLSVSRGIFSVGLGDPTVPNMTQPLSATVFQNGDVYLRSWVDDGAHGSQRLLPDRRVGVAGYALVAGKVLEPVERARTSETFSGQLSGDVLGPQGATVVNRVGSATAGQVVSTVSTVEHATPGNVAGALVRRDGSGNFLAGTVTGRFVGDGSGLTSLNPAQLNGSLPPAMVEAALPAGVTLASTVRQDEALISKGFRQIATLSSPAWSSGNSVNAPSARSGHSAIWANRQMLVWGGAISSGAQYINTGASYDPDADLWTSISPVNAPEPRGGHRAIWTGAEMVIWGGKGTAGFLGTGGRFRPDTQRWTATSTIGAPSARTGHIAIWTGQRLLIWGGQNTAGLLSDGAVYNPTTDTWAPLNLPGAPEARTEACAVWTGSQVLIWGGQGAAGLLNTGAELRFSAQEQPVMWLLLPLANAPSARRFHSAVWSGAHLVVWGGESDDTPLADGAAFELFSGVWQPLPSTGAPPARARHGAVWTGEEMLVFGGTDGLSELSSGAAFNPFAKVWRPLTSSGNPLGRVDAGVVWTGSEMLVFGGVAEGRTVSVLQRLMPQPSWFLYRKL